MSNPPGTEINARQMPANTVVNTATGRRSDAPRRSVNSASATAARMTGHQRNGAA